MNYIEKFGKLGMNCRKAVAKTGKCATGCAEYTANCGDEAAFREQPAAVLYFLS